MQQRNDPFFIVGAPRSGTTMLSVLLDSHSRITIPPETQFFTEFLPHLGERLGTLSKPELVHELLQFKRLADCRLTEEGLLQALPEKPDPGQVLGTVLREYARDKGCPVVGEKSPFHINHLPQIRSFFPHAKIICIVRDGRDVVRSLMGVPWAEPGNPRRFYLFCKQWNQCCAIAIDARQREKKELFQLVKYEDILRSPHKTLGEICSFLGEQLEPGQLQAHDNSDTVPQWEEGWKKKATSPLDITRIGAWKKEASDLEKCSLNYLMSQHLKAMGYEAVETNNCSTMQAVKLFFVRLALSKRLEPIVLFVIKIGRLLRA